MSEFGFWLTLDYSVNGFSVCCSGHVNFLGEITSVEETEISILSYHTVSHCSFKGLEPDKSFTQYLFSLSRYNLSLFLQKGSTPGKFFFKIALFLSQLDQIYSSDHAE